MGDKDNLVEYYKNNRYRKLNNTDEKSNEEIINNYRLTKTELEKQLFISPLLRVTFVLFFSFILLLPYIMDFLPPQNLYTMESQQ